MNFFSKLLRFTSHLAGCVRKSGKQTWFFCFIPVLKISSGEAKTVIRLLGLRIYQKDAVSTIRAKVMESYARLRESAQPRHYLLYDCLYDAHAEAIDSWSMFLYLREQGIPAKYVLRQDNQLANLQHTWQSDITLVESQNDFLCNHHELIAGACCIISSFGLDPLYDKMLRQLPFLKHVFIEHGVTFLKQSTIHAYSPERFTHILAPCTLSHSMHLEHGVWKPEELCCHGMPRWDLLTRQPHEGKNIFIFFTWRSTFIEQPELSAAYFRSIHSLLTHPDFLRLVRENHLQVNLALHHTLYYYGISIPEFPDYVHLVDIHQISQYIRTADLLITDYSSICFDFMFLDIPVIFYRFDANATQLNKTDTHSALYAASKDELLYNCVYDEADVLQRLQHYANSDFELEECHVRKNNAIFWEKQDIRKGLYESLQP